MAGKTAEIGRKIVHVTSQNRQQNSLTNGDFKRLQKILMDARALHTYTYWTLWNLSNSTLDSSQHYLTQFHYPVLYVDHTSSVFYNERTQWQGKTYGPVTVLAQSSWCLTSGAHLSSGGVQDSALL